MTAIGEGGPVASRSVWGPLGGDFGLRLASALVLFGLALLVVWLGGWPFAIWIVLACGVMAMEWERMTQRPFAWAGVAIAVLFIGAAAALSVENRDLWGLGAVGAGAVAAFAYAQMKSGNGAWAAVLPLYLGIPAVALIALRAESWLPTLWMLFVIWATDSCAMISGRIFGGPLLAPAISPKKTWSGFVGGTLGAIVIGLTFAFWVGHRAPDITLAVVIAGLSIIGQGGDVAESAIKRRFNAKDAGGTIPGHGGMLDRMDSLLAVTVAFVALRLVWPDYPFGAMP